MPIYQKYLEKDSCLDFADHLLQKGLDIFNNFFVSIRLKPRPTLALKPLCIFFNEAYLLFKKCPKKVEPLLLVAKYAYVIACVGICLCSAVYISLLDKLIAQAAGNQMFLRILRSKQ